MLDSIRHSILGIKYNPAKLNTYLVFAPVVSLVIQKIQFAEILPRVDSKVVVNPTKENNISRRFSTICKWHLRGSIVQTLALVVAMKVLAAPILGVFALLSAYELADTAYKSLRKVTIHEFEAGKISKSKTATGLNIF